LTKNKQGVILQTKIQHQERIGEMGEVKLERRDLRVLWFVHECENDLTRPTLASMQSFYNGTLPRKVLLKNHERQLPVESLDRLSQKGYLDKLKLLLTQKGDNLIVKIQEKYGKLAKGVPIAERKRVEPEVVFEMPLEWFTATFHLSTKNRLHDYYATVTRIFVYRGKPPALLTGTASLKQQAFESVQGHLSKHTDRAKGHYWMDLEPYAYQASNPLTNQLIWLRTLDKAVTRIIQAPVYDFLLSRFPAGVFQVRTGSQEQPLRMIIPGETKGLFRGGVAAIVMPCVNNKTPCEVS
jgi:hypothetical protein